MDSLLIPPYASPLFLTRLCRTQIIIHVRRDVTTWFSDLGGDHLTHLNKDFVEFTEHNPSDYLRLRHRFHVENPNHSLDVSPLPID